MGGHIKEVERGRSGKKRYRISVEAGIDPATGKRKRIVRYYEGRKEDAQEYLARLMTDYKRGDYLEPSRLTLTEWLKTWLEEYKHPPILRPTTYETYEIMIRVHIIPALGHTPLQELRSEDLQKFYNKLLRTEKASRKKNKEATATKNDKDKSPAKTYSTRTVSYCHMIINQALKQAMKVRPPLIQYNPADGTTPPTPQYEKVVPLTKEQLAAFLEVARPDRLFAAYFLIACTGLRRGELLGLRWQDVDLEKGTINLIRSWTRTNKGPQMGPLKTKTSERTVPIPAMAVKELEAKLQAHKTQQKKEKMENRLGYKENDLVFRQPDGKPIDPDFFTKHFQVLLKRAGIPRARLHDLRHTFATVLLQAGEYPKVVQELLGHARIGVTMDIYSHVAPQLKERAASRMDGVLSSLGTKTAPK